MAPVWIGDMGGVDEDMEEDVETTEARIVMLVFITCL